MFSVLDTGRGEEGGGRKQKHTSREDDDESKESVRVCMHSTRGDTEGDERYPMSPILRFLLICLMVSFIGSRA